jgi:hypothetical protein
MLPAPPGRQMDASLSVCLFVRGCAADELPDSQGTGPPLDHAGMGGQTTLGRKDKPR